MDKTKADKLLYIFNDYTLNLMNKQTNKKAPEAVKPTNKKTL